jgi:S-adenosylmethionine decarboxylase
MPIVGNHIIVDFYGVNSHLLEKIVPLKDIVERAIDAGGLTRISSDYFQFSPIGVSGIVLISESHVSFHTFPEHNILTLDLYTCGEFIKLFKTYELLVRSLEPEKIKFTFLERGEYNE